MGSPVSGFPMAERLSCSMKVPAASKQEQERLETTLPRLVVAG